MHDTTTADSTGCQLEGAARSAEAKRSGNSLLAMGLTVGVVGAAGATQAIQTGQEITGVGAEARGEIVVRAPTWVRADRLQVFVDGTAMPTLALDDAALERWVARIEAAELVASGVVRAPKEPTGRPPARPAHARRLATTRDLLCSSDGFRPVPSPAASGPSSPARPPAPCVGHRAAARLSDRTARDADRRPRLAAGRSAPEVPRR